MPCLPLFRKGKDEPLDPLIGGKKAGCVFCGVSRENGFDVVWEVGTHQETFASVLGLEAAEEAALVEGGFV